LDFSCVEGCSKCCIEREYYPTITFGKVGVLVLPDEKQKIELLAKKHGLEATILPRIGISDTKTREPEQVLAYQLMGKDSNGNTCPFLDTESSERSPHGGYKCKIYQERPAACRAYPVIESRPITLDQKCKFCETCKNPAGNLNSELESLVKIKNKMETKAPYLWRYATGIGEKEDKDKIETGWILV
jgi:Fe-S-cluster containining protein